MFKGLESLPGKERLKEFSLFLLEKAQVGPHHNIQVLKGQLQKGQRLSPHKNSTEKHGMHWEQFHLKKCPPHGCGRVPIAEDFQDM